MPTFRTGTVTRVVAHHSDGVQLLEVSVGGENRQAVLYPRYAATASPGDRVVVNTTAVDLALGTGGSDFVVWNLAHDDHSHPSAGHIMKLRYTPAQSDVLAVESPESPHHEALASALSLDGALVIAASLHSQLLPVVTVLRDRAPEARVAYVMTDGGALEAGLSNTVRRLSDAGWLCGVVTAGHAMGGGLEAVSLHSGLLSARVVLEADVIVAGMGPGIVGTSTPFGTTGLDLGLIVNASVSLGGRTVVALRMSEDDHRDRHRGLSHHVRTALGTVVLRPQGVEVPVPPEVADEVARALPAYEVRPTGDGGVIELLAGQGSHMGRGPDEDPLFFRCAGSAASRAAELL